MKVKLEKVMFSSSICIAGQRQAELSKGAAVGFTLRQRSLISVAGGFDSCASLEPEMLRDLYDQNQ